MGRGVIKSPIFPKFKKGHIIMGEGGGLLTFSTFWDIFLIWSLPYVFFNINIIFLVHITHIAYMFYLFEIFVSIYIKGFVCQSVRPSRFVFPQGQTFCFPRGTYNLFFPQETNISYTQKRGGGKHFLNPGGNEYFCILFILYMLT